MLLERERKRETTPRLSTKTPVKGHHRRYAIRVGRKRMTLENQQAETRQSLNTLASFTILREIRAYHRRPYTARAPLNTLRQWSRFTPPARLKTRHPRLPFALGSKVSALEAEAQRLEALDEGIAKTRLGRGTVLTKVSVRSPSMSLALMSTYIDSGFGYSKSADLF